MAEPSLPSNSARQYYLAAHFAKTSNPPTNEMGNARAAPTLYGRTDNVGSFRAEGNTNKQVKQFGDYIQNNKVSMADALSTLVKNHQYVFTGESHIPGLKSYKESDNYHATNSNSGISILYLNRIT